MYSQYDQSWPPCISLGAVGMTMMTLGRDYVGFVIIHHQVYTIGGCELARVTVIGADLKPIVERLVKPQHPVIDYNTRFSGLTAEDLVGVTTTLQDVQAVLLSLFSDNTILIGHSLESDFVALKVDI